MKIDQINYYIYHKEYVTTMQDLYRGIATCIPPCDQVDHESNLFFDSRKLPGHFKIISLVSDMYLPYKICS